MRNIEQEIIVIDQIIDRIKEIQNVVTAINKQGVFLKFQDYFLTSQNEIIDVLHFSSRPLIEMMGKRFADAPSELNAIVAYLNSTYQQDENAMDTLQKRIESLDVLYDDCLLFSILLKLRSIESEDDYSKTVYHQFITTIFEETKRNRNKITAYQNVMREVDAFLKDLSLEEKGELAITHYRIDYHRNQTIYFQFMEAIFHSSKEQKKIENQFYYNMFTHVLLTLGERMTESKAWREMLASIRATDFYQKEYQEKENQFTNKK